MLVNARTGRAVATVVELADSRATRRKGLLGRDRLDPSAALLLRPCFSIHTAFMRFAIDAVFVDRAGVVVRTVENLRPWRAAASVRAHAVIELAAGALAGQDVRIGDRLVENSKT
jgi:uncharacterized membrane protein (UPF0127 family)